MINLKERFIEQIGEAVRLGKKFKIKKQKFNKILVCGMGGSAFPGDILKDYICNIPVFVIRDYKVPDFVDKNTLAFVISFSGNAEETIAMYKHVKKRKAKSVVIASFGKLAHLAKKDLILVPRSVLPTRMNLPFVFFPMLAVLEKVGLVKRQSSAIKEVEKVIKKLNVVESQVIARKLHNKTPVIYASNQYRAVVERWREDINENSKELAVSNVFSEVNHNEVEAYSKLRHEFSVVMIRDKKDFAKIKKRMNITEKIISDSVNISEVWIHGTSLLARIFYMVVLGDFVSLYLAKLNKVEEPFMNKLIGKIKKKLII